MEKWKFRMLTVFLILGRVPVVGYNLYQRSQLWEHPLIQLLSGLPCLPLHVCMEVPTALKHFGIPKFCLLSVISPFIKFLHKSSLSAQYAPWCPDIFMFQIFISQSVSEGEILFLSGWTVVAKIILMYVTFKK